MSNSDWEIQNIIKVIEYLENSNLLKKKRKMKMFPQAILLVTLGNSLFGNFVGLVAGKSTIKFVEKNN